MSEKQRAPTPPPKSPPLTQSTLEFMVSLSHSGTQGQQSSASNSSQAPLLLAGSQASRSSGTLVEDGLVLMQQQAQEPKGNIMYIQDANGSMIPVVADSGVFPTPYTQEQQQPSKDQLIFMPMNSPMLGEVSPPQYNMPHQQIQKKGIPVNKNPRISMSFVEQPSTYPYQRQQQQGASPKSPKTQQPLALMNASPTTRTPTSKRRNSFASSYMSAKPRSLASMICCCCKSKASRWGCVIFTVLLLVTVGVVVFLFFPRYVFCD